MSVTTATVDDYIASFSREKQAILTEIRNTIKEVVPDAQEVISYQIPTFKKNGMLVAFAGYTNHVGFYPLPSGIEKFKEEISAYKWAKASVQFPWDQPMPLDLIRRLTLFRKQENNNQK